jgi:hypothetical protein
MENVFFYTKLVNHRKPVKDLLSKTNLFEQVPSEWFVVVTDIKGSSELVEKGFSELVNLIATGSIIAALNIAAKYDIDIPFFFGGDGATLLIPPTLLEGIMEALFLHKENILKEYDINLRVGSIPVSDIYENKNELKIAKVSVNRLFTIPIVLGSGLYFAEKTIKSRDVIIENFDEDKGELDLDGMECRWNKILPPVNSNEVVSLLINVLKESEQANLFKKILEKTDEIYGLLKRRNPISAPKLRLNFGYQKIKTELIMSNQKFGVLSFLKVWLSGLIGKYYYLSSKTGQRYLNEVIQLSDILVIDGRISMVISGNEEQRKLLIEYLDKLEKNNQIVYGLHMSRESIISCYVRDRNAKHIHFVDGGSGGYTRAAIVLKEKLRSRS